MTFDHALGSEEGLDLFSEIKYVAAVPQPVWTLGTETETLKTEAGAGSTASVGVHLLVTFLATDPAGIATRLGADGTFGLGRSGSFCLWRLGCLGHDGEAGDVCGERNGGEGRGEKIYKATGVVFPWSRYGMESREWRVIYNILLA